MKLVDKFDDRYQFLANDDTIFYFCTTQDAPRKRIIAIDIETNEITEIIGEHPKNVIRAADAIGIVCKLHISEL